MFQHSSFLELESELPNKFSDEGMAVKDPGCAKLNLPLVVYIPECLDSSTDTMAGMWGISFLLLINNFIAIIISIILLCNDISLLHQCEPHLLIISALL